MRAHLKIQKNFCFFMLLIAFLWGCEKSDLSASNLYKFPNTKPVAVRINIDYKLDNSSGPEVENQEQQFFLNAFLVETDEVQIASGTKTQTAEYNLPVVLTGTRLEFDAVLQVPSAAVPGESGYTFRFALVERNGASLLSFLTADSGMIEDSIKNLDAIKNGIQPGQDAPTNLVNLSLATTITYQIIKESGSAVENRHAVYDSVLELVQNQISATEASLDSSKKTDLAIFASAIHAGVKLKITNDQDLQAAIAQSIQNTTVTQQLSSDGTNQEQKFTDLMKAYASEVNTILGNNDTNTANLFKSETIKTEDIPNPDTYVSVIYAPAALTFTDTDTTDSLGGAIKITLPKIKEGIESFNIYAGGDSKSLAQKKLLGSVSVDLDQLVFTLANATTFDETTTKFWVYPVAGGIELDLGASCPIVNVSIPAGLSYSDPAPTYTASIPIATNTASSTGGKISSYSVSPYLPSGLKLNSATGAITGNPTTAQDASIYTITGSNGQKTTKATITIKVRIAPPTGLAYLVANPVYTVGSSIVTNTASTTIGTASSFNIAPSLPTGLVFDTTTGAITGRPTVIKAATPYTITASNSSGSAVTTMTLSVQSAPPATITLNPPAAIQSGTAFALSGSCSGELGTISVDIGNDSVATAGASSDPLACTCENNSFTCPAVTVTWPTFASSLISYKSTITSAWAGTATHTSNSSTNVLHLALSGVSTIADNATFDPAGSCSPNGAAVTITAPAGFSPASVSCTCASGNISACANLSEATATTNTALSISGTLTHASGAATATQSLSVINNSPNVLSSESGVGNAYKSTQLGGLSFTRYGHNSPAGNLVSHDELMDFIDDPVGHADGIRADGSTATHAYNFAGTSSAGWAISPSESNNKYADSNGEITPVSGGDSFGDTYRGYFVPPEDGVYSFVVQAVDNSVRLMMSPNECPKDAVAIVSADWAANDGGVDPDSIWIAGNGGTYNGGNSYKHNTGVFFAQGTSDAEYSHGTVFLRANKIYYLEIRYGEGGGSNAFAFGMNRRDFNSSTWDGVSNLKASTMLPYAGTDMYIPREACGGSAFNAALLFSDPEGDTLTYGAYLVANDGSTLPEEDAAISSVNLSMNPTTGILTGTLNGNFTNQKIIFTATDTAGSGVTVESSPTTMYP